ncbi:type I restriction enzyme, S subunit [Flavobacterium segetis]|uniref:Type I restriction enzyme, S subunit n=1 Tax=Flavobacterium segetis TaxID=271157 RepID=A0A1M5JKC9_9FLAO|nr:restriction endonuclease subunit S [Flavobacterium segetis]SHG40978.1 type I restriction enzyme, S subunit [Flavobacterium segetis]
MSKISKTILGDLIEFQRGYDLPKSEFQAGEIPVISSNGILGYHNIAKVKAPGITIGRSGTVGLPHYINEDFFPHNTSLFIKDFKGNNPKYIYYLIKTLRLNEYGSGSGVPTMNRNHLHPIKVSAFLDIADQQKIAKVLSDLDAKIELNNKINSELEAMAKTLYDYWFVQFDFPAKLPSTSLRLTSSDIDAVSLSEVEVPYKTSGGKMVYNQELKREIPEGWTTDVLASWIGKDKSGDWGKENLEGNYTEKVHCIRGADLNGLNGKGAVKAPTRYILEKNRHKILDEHDLIVEISGGSPTQSTGRMAYITIETLERFDAPLICSNFCKAVTLEDETYLYNFAFEWDKAYDHGVLFGYEGKTSGIKNLLFESFVSSYNTPKPPREIAQKFYDYMKTIQSKKQKNLKENQQLTSLRDWLLPMLMNGQVRVGEFEEAVSPDSYREVAEGRVEYKKG